MPKFPRLLLLVLLWIIVLGGGFVVFTLLEPSLFRPAVESQIERT